LELAETSEIRNLAESLDIGKPRSARIVIEAIPDVWAAFWASALALVEAGPPLHQQAIAPFAAFWHCSPCAMRKGLTLKVVPLTLDKPAERLRRAIAASCPSQIATGDTSWKQHLSSS